MIVAATLTTPPRFRIILALIVVTQISIFAYSATNPSKLLSTDATNMFRAALSDSQKDAAAASGVIGPTPNGNYEMSPILPMTASQPLVQPSPQASPQATHVQQIHTRAGLFRRRLVEDATGSRTDSANSPGSGNTLSKFTLSSLFRGGSNSGMAAYSIATTAWHTILVDGFCSFANFVGQTKTRCFFLLVFSVIIESYATTLSKQAKDTGNALLFARACFVYLFWYVLLFSLFQVCTFQ
jgi:hypothetical protein